MSLIEEALRKQREEVERDAGKREAGKRDMTQPLTLTPPPLPVTDTTPSTPDPVAAAPGRSWALVAGLFLGGALILVLILGLLFYGWSLWRQRPELSMGSVKTAPVTNLAAKAMTPAPPPSPSPVATNPPPVPVIVPEIPSPTQVVTNIAIPSTPAPAPLKVVVAPPPKPRPVIWPRLSVSGIIGGGKKGFYAAIINGKTLCPGDTTEGVTIKAIENQKVRLVYEGEERTLSAGGIIE
ncbi:MAG: hypothetical protein WCG36_09270 [bacterium]